MLGTTIEILQSVRVGMASVVQARAQLPACKMILAVDGSTRARRKMSSRHSITGAWGLIANHKSGHVHHSCTHISHNKSYTYRQARSGAPGLVTSASSSQSVKLAVIGGGIGGLTCARILQKHGHDVVIYEREPSRNARTQGGNLDMHEESGQWALRQAGLYDRYSELILEGGQDLRIVDHKAKVHWEEVGPPGEQGRPEIHRPALRNLLLDALHPGTIKWDRRLVGIEPQGSQGVVCVHCGTTRPFYPSALEMAVCERGLLAGWAPELVQFIHACHNKITPRPYLALPVGITWSSQSNITLLGDAAHLMSPFAGEGANVAMQDGAELALELVKAIDPADAIAAYEEKMFKRAQVAAQDSAQGLDMLIAPDGAVRFAHFMQSAGGP
ncbi:hypothetical protein WJX82_004541 [Trebouxia sp. C0006]